MIMKFIVTVEVTPNEGNMAPISQAEHGHFVKKAIENALDHAESVGFNHDLKDAISIVVDEVKESTG